MTSFFEAMSSAQAVMTVVRKYSRRSELCGSLRRGLKEVSDIDIVCQDTDRFSLIAELTQIVDSLTPSPQTIKFVHAGIPGEIFFVSDYKQFEVMKLVRTGDHVFIQSLARNALEAGYMLKFSVDPGYYKIPMYGLYKISGTIYRRNYKGPPTKENYTQDMRHPIEYKENQIIWLIYGREIPPEKRSWASSGGDTDSAAETSQDQSVLSKQADVY